MAHQVNLDALIRREDFEVADPGAPSQPTATLQIRNLEPGDFFFSVVRKPDFQRETSDWPPQKIVGFVKSFLDGDLIPALILWQAGSQIFVIDGAHRLSALVAWVHDDYGDRETSRRFFDGVIPEEQVAAAEFTRRLMKREVGSYDDHKWAVQHPEKAKLEVVERARRLGSTAIQLQWVKGDSTKAEESFFKINQQAAPIDKTELRLLKARKLPNAVAARAIVRSGTGHKYWSRFAEGVQTEIEFQAKEINDLLFAPTLKSPIKTLDLPVAGRGYSAQTLQHVFEFVNLVSDVRVDPKLPDATGEETLQHLKRCRSIVNRISGSHPSSLGLHPAVYFYSSTGRYQPTSFLAVVALLKDFDRKNGFRAFTMVRRRFEEFLLRHRVFVNQVTVKYGSGPKGYARLRELFEFVLEQLTLGLDGDDLLGVLEKNSKFSFLQAAEVTEPSSSRTFSTDQKSAVFLRDALREPLRCGICGGLIHRNAISVDHVVRRADGGMGQADNGQLTHPYCNTTIKN